VHALFSSRESAIEPSVEPVSAPFPKIDGGGLAAASFGPRIGGDFYDSFRAGPQRILFGLLDVAGRREDNLHILAAATEIFRRCGAELFSGLDINESDAMTELGVRLNRGLLEASKGVHSCPAFVACYHEEFGTLCYTNAGHTPGLLLDAGKVTELASTGLPLGLFSHATSDAPTVGIEKGGSLLLVSRGVVECKSRRRDCDDEYGLDRVKELLRTDKSHGAAALVASILDGAAEFTLGSTEHDDKTALAFVRSL
jgi:sigma-B regulation protein RsbU (phosphoserine phosphatase)